jgi:membrane protease YdiL (CAAX protease family)
MNDVTRTLIRILPFLIIIIALTVRIKIGKVTKEELGLKKPDTILKSFIWCISFLLFCLLTEYTLNHYGLLEVTKHNFTFKISLLKIVGMVLIAPIAEELIYRGVFLNKLLSLKINKHLAIFLIAMIFVAMHSFTYENNLTSKIGTVQSFLDASLFAYARLSTKSLYTPIIMHMTGNLIATFEMFLL